MAETFFVFYVLFFILAFFIHDMEELFTQRKWMMAHKEELLVRFPRMKSLIEGLGEMTTKAFAIAFFEELVILLLLTCYMVVDGPYCLFLWTALFCAFSLHLLVHVAEGIVLRSYVPGLITSLLLIPYSYVVLSVIYTSMSIVGLIIVASVGVIFVAANLRFSHWLGKRLGNR